MLIDLFVNPVIYVRIYKNRFLLRYIQDQKNLNLTASQPFTTNRLLVGEFTAAEKLLKEGVKALMRGKLFVPSPLILMHPMEMAEGGLSQLEERAIQELGHGAGGRKVKVHIGAELNDAAVKSEMTAT